MKQSLLDLLAIQSTADQPAELFKAITYVKAFFASSSYNFVIRVHECEGKKSIVILPHQTKSPKIFLSGHLDVVPASVDQFKPVIINNKIYARGTRDMKGPNIAMMFALRELVEESVSPSVKNTLKKSSTIKNQKTKRTLDCGLMLTTDEEIGGFRGTNYLLNNLDYRCECAFIPDSNLSWRLCTDEKAVWHVKFSFTGESAHNSRPWLGKSAAIKAIKAYQLLEKSFHEKWGSPNTKNTWIPTVSLGTIQGGSSTNQVPYQANFTVDIRFPAQIKRSAIKNVLDFIAKQFTASWSTKAFGNAMHTPINNYFSQKWIDSVHKTTPHKVSVLQSPGASDGRYFSALGIPVVMCNPLSSEPHINKEWIDYEDLVLFKDCLKDWIRLI